EILRFAQNDRRRAQDDSTGSSGHGRFGNPFLHEGLDHVADLDVVKVLQSDPAFHPGPYLVHVILKPPQGPNTAQVNYHAVAEKSDGRLAGYLAVLEVTTRHHPDVGD